MLKKIIKFSAFPLLFLWFSHSSFSAQADLKIMTEEKYGVKILGVIEGQQSLNIQTPTSVVNVHVAHKSIALLKFLKSNKIDVIPNGATVIEPHVLWEANINWLLLALKDRPADVVLEVLKSGFGGEKNADPKDQKAVPMGENYIEEGFERDHGHIKITEAYKTKIITQDLSKILMQAASTPIYQDGQIIGFELSDIDPTSIFVKAGIQDGDIITKINDQALNDVGSTIRLLQSLKTAKTASVDMLRGGATQKISLNVE